MNRVAKKKTDPSRRPADSTTVVAEYYGPLPSAGQMEKYESTLPGAAERIMTMAEIEQRTRHFLEVVGLFGGFIMWLALLVATVTLAYMGANIAAGVVGSGVGLMMLDRFLRGRKDHN